MEVGKLEDSSETLGLDVSKYEDRVQALSNSDSAMTSVKLEDCSHTMGLNEIKYEEEEEKIGALMSPEITSVKIEDCDQTLELIDIIKDEEEKPGHLINHDFFAMSESGSVSPTDATLASAAASAPASTTAPEPLVPSTPTRPAASTPATGQRKRRRKQEHLTVLREMLTSDVKQNELNRAQRQRHLQMALDDAAQARDLEAALRREEISAMSSFNQAFLGTLSQLVHALNRR
ncbi:hypothetical protein DPEC_G00135900 [Dallia pectoralis]|uniref:Uncharacterized protein n=1 Tax=Dallia pectoralis TaxID=75939 RepID=A0ACC2GLF7_DALPE|nr:hypothetical protein DPEC_G00135900 [Dallia pectoralis]